MPHLPRHALQALDPRALIGAASLASAALLAACAGGAPAKLPPSSGPADAVLEGAGGSGRALDAAAARPLPLMRRDDLDPDILLPDPASTDAVLSTVGELAVHKRHVFDRLVEINPQLAKELITALENDALLVREARRFGIAIRPEMVDQQRQQREDELREQIERELADGTTLEAYLQRQMGLSLDEYRRLSRLSYARELYRNYVVRFIALREDRVQVRFLVHADRDLLEEVARKVRAGADFATLAIRHSEDEATRRDGGLLPPFGAGFDHPVARVAFQMKPGELSEILELEEDGKTRLYLVYCLRQIPGRVVAFAEVREEIEAEIRRGPLSAFEVEVVYRRLRNGLEGNGAAAQRR